MGIMVVLSLMIGSLLCGAQPALTEKDARGGKRSHWVVEGVGLTSFLQQCQTVGDVRVMQDKGVASIVIQGKTTDGLSRLTYRLPATSLHRHYLLTVEARSNTSQGQIMLTEGFLWGSSEKVCRFIRRLLPGDEEYAVFRIPFEVRAVPFYVNCGVLWYPDGQMHVRRLELQEITSEEFRRHGVVKSDMFSFGPKSEMYKEARERLLAGTVQLLSSPRLPSAVRAEVHRIQAMVRGQAVRQNEKILNEAKKVLGEGQRIMLLSGGLLNPPRVSVIGGKVRLTLYQCQSTHSVWYRWETSDPGVTFRVVGPNGKAYLLNEADAVNVPAGEGMELEISGLDKTTELVVLPLDHCGTDVERRLILACEK